MPYFIYKIFDRGGEKELEYVEEYEAFVDAKKRARAMRAEAPPPVAGVGYTVKIMFAGARGEAEAQLAEKREAPILREWEK